MHYAERALALFAFCSGFAALLVAGCASPTVISSTAPSGSPPPQNAQSISVTISPASFTLQAGQTKTFTATVQNDSQNKGVTWTLAGAGCSGAACGTLSVSSSASGTALTYTAPTTVPSPATVTLLATSVTDPTKSASATITITAPPPPVTVNVAPTGASVTVGQTQTFSATVQNDPQNKGVTWTLSGAGCSGASCGMLSSNSSASGAAITYTAPPTAPSPATVTLTATSVADTTKSSAATITVTSPAPPVSVSVSPSSASVQTGQTQNFTATVQNDPLNRGVTWTLSGSGCSGATCGALSANSSTSGAAITYAAPTTAPSPATVTLTATSVADTTKSSTATITVTLPPPPVSVNVSPANASVQILQTQIFVAAVKNDPQNKGVTWTLSGSGCSGSACGTLSNTSPSSTTYTAPLLPPNPATVALIATSVTDTSRSSSATITITIPPPPVSVSVSPSSASVQTGQTQNFTATVQGDPLNRGVTWTLSGSGCSSASCGTLSATSSASGTAITYTAPTAVPNPPTVTLTATSVADATKSSAATITVTSPPPVSVSVSPSSSSVQTNQAQSFTATVQNDPQNKGVTWTLSGSGCSGATCGTLSASSSPSGVAITYTAPNSVPNPSTVTLTATSVADGTKNSAANITVTSPPPPVSVTVSPASQSVQTNQAQSFTATVQNEPQNKGVTWTLSSSGCSGASCGTLSATSSASGAAITYTAPATVPNPATVTLTATSVADTSKTATATITITAPAAVAVSVAPTSQSVATGQTQTFTATVQNEPQNKGVTWTLSGSGCSGASCGTLSATSSASGAAITYTAPATVPNPATVTLTATSVADNTKTANATITVVQSSGNISVAISPKRGGLTLSQTLNLTATIQNDTNNQGVTWSASGGSFPSSKSTSAVYQAPNTAGVYTITATSVADATKSASAVIGVTDLGGVTTYHNDLARDGVNSKEYALTPSNVSSAAFGKLFSCPVDTPVYPQPLWVANVNMPNGRTRNLIIVATENDSVYAFDADASPCMQYWYRNLIPPGEVAPPYASLGGSSGDFQSTVGIVGTPVIDPATQTIYLVTKTQTQGTTCLAGGCHQRLYALNLADGTTGASVELTSAISVSGTGEGSAGGQLPFNAATQNQRAGLALVNNTVYIAWASHEDRPPYHGWLMGFNKSNIGAAPITLVTTPNGASGGGIWMSGGAPAVDNNNNIYVITGNGDYNPGSNDYGDSMLKLDTTLTIHDWLTPSDQTTLDGGNLDFGGGGATVLVDLPSSAPFPHLLIGGGKNDELYVANRDSMGHLENGNGSNIVQKFSLGAMIFATGAFWQNTFYIAAGPVTDKPGVDSGPGTPLQAFTLDPSTSQFNTTPASSSSVKYPERGTTPSVSSTGASNGIVWAIDASQWGGGSHGTGPAVLHAYDATNLNNELWNSSQSARDQAGNAVKFTVPTVANGKVYIGTTTEIDVYGLLPN